MSEKKNKRAKGATVSPYEVGKGKPPKAGRIKPGEVRNPKGRPRKPKIGARDLDYFLDEIVTVPINGREEQFSKRELMYNGLATRAAKSDLRAIKVVLDYTRASSGDAPADPLLFDPELTRALLREMQNSVANDHSGIDEEEAERDGPTGRDPGGAEDGPQ